MVGQHVGRAQQQFQGFLVRRNVAAADQVQRGLEHMAEADQLLEAEGPGTALDGMDRPEHRIDDLGVVVAPLHGQQPAFEFGELLLALLEEGNLDGG